MSCCICLNEPPEAPVSTVDGQVYCLGCITEWFEKGNGKSPVTGLDIPKILIPATTLCQNLNIPITKIPDEFTYKNDPNLNLQQKYDTLRNAMNGIRETLIERQNILVQINRERNEQFERQQQIAQQREREKQELVASVQNLIPIYLRDSFPKFDFEYNEEYRINNYKTYVNGIAYLYSYMENTYNIKPEELLLKQRFINNKFGEIDNPFATMENGKIYEYTFSQYTCKRISQIPVGLKYLARMKEMKELFPFEKMALGYNLDHKFIEYWNNQIPFKEVVCNPDFIKNELINMKLVDSNSKYTRFILQKFTNFELIRILQACTGVNAPNSIVRREMIDQILQINPNFDLNVWYQMYNN